MKKLILTNTLWQVLSRITTATSFAIVTALITRHLGPDFYGKFSVVLTYMYMFFVLSEFGFGSFLVKEFSQDKTKIKKYYSNILFFKICYGLVLSALAIFIVNFLQYSVEIKRAIYLISPIFVIQSIYTSNLVIFQTLGKYIYQFISVFIGTTISILLSYYFIFHSPSLNHQVLAYLLGYLILTVISVIFAIKSIDFTNFKLNIGYTKLMIIESGAFGFSILINFLMINADRLIMTFYSTYTDIAIYSVAYKVFEILLIIPAFFMNAFYPILSNLRASDLNIYRKKALKAMYYLSMASAIVLVAILATSNIFIPKIFGEELAESYVALNLLAIGLPFFFLTAPLSWLMVLEKRQTKLLIINVSVLILNVFLCWIYIPIYGYKAAAWITTLSELIILILDTYYLRDFLFKKHKSV